MSAKTIILPGERPVSWNQFYAGQHWRARKAEVDRVHLAVRAVIDPEAEDWPPPPLDVTVRAYFDKRPLDADNVAAKLYIDGLIGWAFPDDSPEHVRSVRTVSLRDAASPRVEIELQAAKIA